MAAPHDSPLRDVESQSIDTHVGLDPDASEHVPSDSHDNEAPQTRAAEEQVQVTKNDIDDPFCVNFEHNDPHDPRMYPTWRKIQICLVTTAQLMWVTVISSIYSFGAHPVAEEFGISDTKARIAAAVFLFGLGIGPVVAAPLSEDFGRVPVMVVAMALVGITQIPCALAPNIAVLIVFRFLGGVFGAASYNAVGTVSDLWGPDEQGWGVNTFTIAAEAGTLGPVIGGYVVQYAGWRWTFGVSGIVTAFLLVVFFLTVPETRAGVILTRRATMLRKQHNEPRYFTLHEKQRAQHTVSALAKEMIGRPLFMLFTEPIVFWFALFDGVNYAVIYIFLEAYPLVFEQYGFNLGQQGLTFLGLGVGFLIAFGLYYFQMKWEAHAGTRRPDGQPTPEDRLLWGIPGGFLFPISLFFFAWTSYPPVPWIVPVIAGATFGISSHILFLLVSDYTVNAYSIYAASAIAAQSFLREFLAGSFTLAAEPMYARLGNQWASTLLAFIGLILSVIPVIFFKFGPIIRARSSFAQELQRVEQEQKEYRNKLASRATTLNEPASAAGTANKEKLASTDPGQQA
ncbi:MFS general substrate transporter [Testicularia cyperi]|uniref:MFS general substrate transporter n=1 Tax=Testicularia cyperi TaxID=1882483 RepID=A0A317XRZ8_9BASI|nr:MFS general substrate transporter [Testicularia cyperi]